MQQAYRLPTEAEWEYACRAGTTTAYWFGDDPAKFDAYGWYEGNSSGAPHKVAEKKPNPWGLYDMHGNSYEWCADGWDEKREGGDDPVARYSDMVKTTRGGFYGMMVGACRSASRSCDSTWSSDHFHTVGFRVVRCG
jgi:formylglycine-generating enzyme required for sulfatase activity